MNIILDPLAELESDTAFEYYSMIRPELGISFSEQLETTLEKIKANPMAWPPGPGKTRHCRINQFPYGVVYSYYPSRELILIHAIMHLHRRPGYWLSRLKWAR